MIKLLSSANPTYPTYKDVERIIGKGLDSQLRNNGLENMRYKEWSGDSNYEKAEFLWIAQEPFDDTEADIFFDFVEERAARLFNQYPGLDELKVTLYVRDDRSIPNNWDVRVFLRSR